MNKTRQILTDDAYKAIEEDPQLFGDVCEALHVKPVSLPQMITRKSRRLTEYPVLRLIAKKQGTKPENLLKTA